MKTADKLIRYAISKFLKLSIREIVKNRVNKIEQERERDYGKS